MAIYDYKQAVKDDLEAYYGDTLSELATADEWGMFPTREAIAESIAEMAWTDDAVTGNGSGSYTFNSYKAADYVTSNTDLLGELVAEGWLTTEELGEKVANGEFEWLDVALRCFVLNEAANEYVNENLDELPDYMTEVID